ncbi:MAG TPA: acetyltransferase [Steroidobacteraceae bacterium]|nr:acetyltransferase [Steroidobacteraceae bacterium]
MSKSLVIVGNGQMAELFYLNFTHFSDYRVAGFAVDRQFIGAERLHGLPVVPFEEMQLHFGPESFHAFVAIGPMKNNSVRAERFLDLRQKGYRFANCISPHAVVSPDASIGENVVIGHLAVVSPWARIGDNVLIGTGSSVGHHCQVHDHAFLPVHVIMAGSVIVGERAFVGAGATIRDNVTIGEGSVISAGATILGDVEPNSVYGSSAAKPLPMRADQARL